MRVREVKVEVVTPAAEDPVSLTEAKAHCRVDHATDDALIALQIKAATLWAEQESGRALVTQTLRAWFGAFPGLEHRGVLVLPRPKVQSITHLKYFDAEGVETTLAASGYRADLIVEPAEIAPAYGESWPAAYGVANAVQVQYVAGYGTAAAVDPRAKQAILLIVGHWYEHREHVLVGTISKEIEAGARAALGQLHHGWRW